LPDEQAAKPDTEVKLQHTRLGSKLDATTYIADPFILAIRILLFTCIFELIDLKRVNTTSAWS
jgi:hypothetical protein